MPIRVRSSRRAHRHSPLALNFDLANGVRSSPAVRPWLRERARHRADRWLELQTFNGAAELAARPPQHPLLALWQRHCPYFIARDGQHDRTGFRSCALRRSLARSVRADGFHLSRPVDVRGARRHLIISEQNGRLRAKSPMPARLLQIGGRNKKMGTSGDAYKACALTLRQAPTHMAWARRRASTYLDVLVDWVEK